MMRRRSSSRHFWWGVEAGKADLFELLTLFHVEGRKLSKLRNQSCAQHAIPQEAKSPTIAAGELKMSPSLTLGPLDCFSLEWCYEWTELHD